MKMGDLCEYEGKEWRVVGVTYSHREFRGGLWLQLLPVGSLSLSDSVCGVPAWKVSFASEEMPAGITLVKG